MPSPGAVLDGKYRLVRQLGAGGMGIVYEADHIRLRQPFAIKVLQAEFAGVKEFLMRFEREARAAALLRSPHVVRVYDVDVCPDGLTYMVMELLEGHDLAAEALEGPIAVAQLVDWIIQTCAGLQEAHDNGIVHRDLKPPNIFLAKIESGDRIAKVLDFGISKLEATSTSHMTDRRQGALGTPTYMAPEQIRNRRVDGRADLWALGVILYRVLASRWPFSGKGDQGYMAAVLSDPPLPFELVRPDLPYELASVIMKALEKDAAARHQSASDLATALAPFGSGRAPLQTGTSLPPPPLIRPTPMAALEPQPPPPRPHAIVMVGGAATRVDRAGMMDTVVDTTPHAFGPPQPLARASGSLTAAPFGPETTTQPRRGGGVAVVIAAGFAASLGFGAYMLATRKTAPVTVERQPTQSATSLNAESPPPPAIDLPSAPASSSEARPAQTGVAVEPSAAASHRRQTRTIRPPASAAAAPDPAVVGPVAPPTAPSGIPDHL